MDRTTEQLVLTPTQALQLFGKVDYDALLEDQRQEAIRADKIARGEAVIPEPAEGRLSDQPVRSGVHTTAAERDAAAKASAVPVADQPKSAVEQAKDAEDQKAATQQLSAKTIAAGPVVEEKKPEPPTAPVPSKKV